jgi:hypothetical protein
VSVTALDLSLTATGLFHGDPTDPKAAYSLAEIATPARRKDESDISWNARRYDRFSGTLLTHLVEQRPDLLVIEITSHAHQVVTRNGKREQTTRGHEFRAGLGLGRALGWIDGVLVLATAHGCVPATVETIEAKTVKLRVAGSESAPKAAVADYLRQIFGWDTTGWKESQIDALAVGVAWCREVEYAAKEAKLQALAARASSPRTPRAG